MSDIVKQDMYLGTNLETLAPHTEDALQFAKSNSVCVAPTGAGKTSFWLTRLLYAFLQGGVKVCLFDGAQDAFLYHFVLALATTLGFRVRVLFDNNRLLSEKLDPFSPFRAIGISANDIRDATFRFGNVPYSKRYGESWYGLASLKAAQDGAVAVLRERISVTLPNIIEKMRALARESRDGEQILYSLLVASSHDAISSVDDGSPEFVRWEDVEKGREMVLVSWNARNPASSFFASTIHQSLVMHAHLQGVAGRRGMQWAIIGDEWPTLMSSTSVQSLAMDRKEGISHHLLHQSRGQIDAVDPFLAGVVMEQCQFEMHFAMGLDSQEYIQGFSKMHEATLKGRTISQHGLALSEREFRDRVLELNHLLEVAGTFGAGVLVRKVHEGFREPIKLLFEHEISREAYDYLSSLPLPLKPPPPPPKPMLRDAAWDARNAALAAAFDACRRREGGLRSRGT
jgi:hypothetical protein